VVLSWVWVRGYPRVAGDGVAERSEYVVAVFGGGGEVAADGVAVLGTSFAGQPAGHVLLVLAGAVGRVRPGWRWADLEVVGEAQRVVGSVAQDPVLWLPSAPDSRLRSRSLPLRRCIDCG
jgi:hypothetical protein